MTAPYPNQEQALCAQTDPDMFFPEEGDYRSVMEAKKVCQQCPVRLECLTYALETFRKSTDWGVWGGTTVAERRILRRGKRASERTIHLGERKVNEKGRGQK